MNGYKTLVGLAIAAIPNIATMFGFDTAPSFQGDATELVSAIIQVGGLLFALYGRLVATVPGWFTRKPE